MWRIDAVRVLSNSNNSDNYNYYCVIAIIAIFNRVIALIAGCYRVAIMLKFNTAPNSIFHTSLGEVKYGSYSLEIT